MERSLGLDQELGHRVFEIFEYFEIIKFHNCIEGFIEIHCSFYGIILSICVKADMSIADNMQ